MGWERGTDESSGGECDGEEKMYLYRELNHFFMHDLISMHEIYGVRYHIGYHIEQKKNNKYQIKQIILL